jgi:uncharacterized protein (DUF1697 family)
MGRHVGFMRAVNLPGRQVPMARVRDAVTALGFEDVSTYINSGNVLFVAPGKAADLEARLEACFAREFPFEIPTFVRSATEVERAATHKPFGTIADGHTHMVVFLRSKPTATERRALEARSNDTDELVVDGRDVHHLVRGKLMASTLKAKDWAALGDQLTTARNTTMLEKLAAKLGG